MGVVSYAGQLPDCDFVVVVVFLPWFGSDLFEGGTTLGCLDDSVLIVAGDRPVMLDVFLFFCFWKVAFGNGAMLVLGMLMPMSLVFISVPVNRGAAVE